MKLGMLVPMPQELVGLTRKKPTPGQCISVGENLTVCLTGVGKNSTKTAFENLIKYPVDLVISWGTAAGLAPQILAGDVIIPTQVKTPTENFITDAQFSQLLKNRVPDKVKVIDAPLAETSGVLRTAADKLSLYQTSSCVAADMESGIVARLAQEHKLPFAVIRAVSDPVNTRLPELILGSFKEGSFDLWRFLSKALISPAEWKTIYELSGGFKKAKNSLKTIARLLVADSGSWSHPSQNN